MRLSIVFGGILVILKKTKRGWDWKLGDGVTLQKLNFCNVKNIGKILKMTFIDGQNLSISMDICHTVIEFVYH